MSSNTSPSEEEVLSISIKLHPPSQISEFRTSAKAIEIAQIELMIECLKNPDKAVSNLAKSQLLDSFAGLQKILDAHKRCINSLENVVETKQKWIDKLRSDLSATEKLANVTEKAYDAGKERFENLARISEERCQVSENQKIQITYLTNKMKNIIAQIKSDLRRSASEPNLTESPTRMQELFSIVIDSDEKSTVSID